MSDVSFDTPENTVGFAVVIVSMQDDGSPLVSQEHYNAMPEGSKHLGAAMLGHAVKQYGESLLDPTEGDDDDR